MPSASGEAARDHQAMNQEKDEVEAAKHLRSVLGESTLRAFGWVRVVQVVFRYLEWTEINEALKDHRPDHESVRGAINNLRQIEMLTASANKRLRADYGTLFESYFTFVRDADHGWSPAREVELRSMIEYVQQQDIAVSEVVSKQLRQDYPSLWRR